MDTHIKDTQYKETFYMTEQDKLRESVFQKLTAGKINGTAAAQALGITIRQVRRLKKRFKKKGILGILHKNRGKPSNRSLDTKHKDRIVEVIKTKFPDFGPTLAQEKLAEDFKLQVSVETVRSLMTVHKLWTPRPIKAEKHPHTWRARKDCYGQMQQYDGSYHNWFEGRLKDTRGNAVTEVCLLASIDDATGKLTGLKFAVSEGVMPTLDFWCIYLKIHGKPMEIYLDNYSTYKNSARKNNTAVDLDLTQFERAMQQLGVVIIHARSPQAKGRIERVFQTLQDRLVKELRLKDVSTIEEANQFLTKLFIPAFNKRFSVVPRSETNMHRALSAPEHKQLPIICAMQETRRVMNDYTIAHNRRLYQINPKQQTLVRVGDQVIICTKLNSSKAIVKAGRQLEFTEITERPHRLTVPKGPDKRLIGRPQPLTHPWKKQPLILPRTVALVSK